MGTARHTVTQHGQALSGLPRVLRTKEVEQKIDEVVYGVYGLTEEERRVVEGQAQDPSQK